MGYKREYMTTFGSLANEKSDGAIPIQPPGDGWVFVNGTASTKALYFFWYRDVKVEESEEDDGS
jgi:hypothetical protein